MSMFNQVEKVGTLACRALQRILVVLIFVLFFVFAYAYLHYLFVPVGHRDPIPSEWRMVYLGLGLWFFYNLIYNYTMSNIIGPGTSSTLPPSSTHTHNIPKICKKCHLPKPIRTHHCPICNKCILQMDRTSALM